MLDALRIRSPNCSAAPAGCGLRRHGSSDRSGPTSASHPPAPNVPARIISRLEQKEQATHSSQQLEREKSSEDEKRVRGVPRALI